MVVPEQAEKAGFAVGAWRAECRKADTRQIGGLGNAGG